MVKTKPLISIVICNYNYARYIREAIESALNQTYDNVEIIVIDDGSTDKSLAIINQFSKNTRIRIIARKNMGVIFSRNQGLKEAKGQYICFLDADDIFESDYIANMLDVALATDADVVYGDMKIIDAKGDETGQKYIFPNFSLDELKRRNYINMAALIKMSAASKQDFDKELDAKKYTHEDWDYFLGLAMQGKKMIKADNVFLRYRVHEHSRNGGIVEVDLHSKHLRSAVYIYDKYRSRYPAEFEADPSNNPLRHWVSEMVQNRDGLQKTVRVQEENLQKRQEGIAIKDEKIAHLSKSLTDLLESKSYRLGRAMSAPYRQLNRRKNDQ